MQTGLARSYLTTVFADHVDQSAGLVIWSLPSKQSQRCTTVEDAVNYAESLGDGADIFYGVGLYKVFRGGRGTARHVVCLPALWADVDIYDPQHHPDPELPQSIQQAAEWLTKLPCPPAIIIHTGHGIQGVWPLTEPIDGTDMAAESARWHAALARYAAAAGFKFDQSTRDISRVLRLPGSRNNKGEPSAEVTLQHFDLNLRYDLSDHISQMVDAAEQEELPDPSDCGDGVAPRSLPADYVRQVAEDGGAFEIRDPVPEDVRRQVEVWCANIQDFADVWNFKPRVQRRFGLDCSTYLLCIANHCVSAQLSNQQTVDIMVLFQHHFRKLVPERPVHKHKSPWYYRTIYVARFDRHKNPERQAREEHTQKVKQQGKHNEEVQKHLHVDVLKIVQRGEHKAEYFCHLADGTVIELGGVKDFKSKARWQDLILMQCRVYVSIDPRDWPSVMDILTDMIEIEDIEEQSDVPREEFLDSLSGYLGLRKPIEVLTHLDVQYNTKNAPPFMIDGQLAVSSSDMARTLRNCGFDHNITAKRVSNGLKEYCKAKKWRPDGVVTYWLSRESFNTITQEK